VRLVDRSIRRLNSLLDLAKEQVNEEGEVDSSNVRNVPADRLVLLGSAHKRKGVLDARRYLQAEPGVSWRDVARSLSESKLYYRAAVNADSSYIEVAEGNHSPDPHPLLNWILLKTVYNGQFASDTEPGGIDDTGLVDVRSWVWKPDEDGVPPDATDRTLTDELARALQLATANYSSKPDYWNAVASAEFLLADHLRSQQKPSTSASATSVTDGSTIDEIFRRFSDAFAAVASPKQLDSTIAQLWMLRDLYRAKLKFRHESGGEGTQFGSPKPVAPAEGSADPAQQIFPEQSIVAAVDDLIRRIEQS
jgi:hypothetical protein